MMNSPNGSKPQPQPPKSPQAFGEVIGFFWVCGALCAVEEPGGQRRVTVCRCEAGDGYSYRHGLGKNAMAGSAPPCLATPLRLFLRSRDAGSAPILSDAAGCDPTGLGHPCHQSPAPSCSDSGLVRDTVTTQHPCLLGHQTPAGFVPAPRCLYGKVGCTSARRGDP